MNNLIKKHMEVEKQIQELIEPLTRESCGSCRKVCCEKVYCRESVTSAFLSKIVAAQDLEYDKKKGWLGVKGCRLGYGRPPICYEFFCGKFYREGILDFDSKEYSYIPKIINDFVSFGNNAFNRTHLICVDTLELISKEKINKMTKSLDNISHQLDQKHSDVQPYLYKNHITNQSENSPSKTYRTNAYQC
jgi:hypothetical protein